MDLHYGRAGAKQGWMGVGGAWNNYTRPPITLPIISSILVHNLV